MGGWGSSFRNPGPICAIRIAAEDANSAAPTLPPANRELVLGIVLGGFLFDGPLVEQRHLPFHDPSDLLGWTVDRP